MTSATVPHPYALDKASQAFAAEAMRIAREVAAPHAAAVDQQARFPQEALAALGKAGLWGLCVDAAHGGKAAGPGAFCAVVEELAQACGSTAMVYVMHVTGAQMLAASTTLGDRDALLREIAAGRHLTTLAFSEKGSRSQFWAPVSRLAEQGGQLTTDAQKSWVTSAKAAHSYVSSAQKPGAASPMESTLYLVRRGRPGQEVVATFDGLGLRGNDSAPVKLTGYEVAPGDLLTAQGSGAEGMLQVVLPWFVLGTSAMAMGICRAALAATIAHVSAAGFEHAGTTLRDLPNLRARIAEMSIKTEQSRALLGHTLAHMGAGSPMTPLYVLQTRAAALQTALDVTDLAMRTCGGAAFSRQLGLERMFRDARAGWVMAPTVDHLHDFVGRALTGLPLF
jgi:alkylation response protein AidB-like acyl-CoA dehydrogenase